MLGGQVFQRSGSIVVANQRAVEPIVGERIATAVPDKVFDRKMTIKLGGHTIELHHVAPSHSDSMTLVLFPQHRALQCTDLCGSGTMPFNDFLDFYYTGWIDTLDWAIRQDIDFVDVGHYTPASKKDVAEGREYMVDLHQQVLDLVRAGQAWDQLYRNVRFSDKVRGWQNFDTMNMLNIAGMYRWVSNHRRGNW
jgi:glyoxylase-like metal-dependent hydrolase (beta-lactamase superfamily II)